MEKDLIKVWASKDLWSERELEELCCGLEPNGARSNTDELNKAHEEVLRAVLAGTLPCIQPADATPGDKMYGHARFFKPIDAIQWAASRFQGFPKFPVKKLTSSIDTNIDDLSPLRQSKYWALLEQKAEKAVKEYPTWRKQQNKVQKSSNLHDWLVKTLKADTREAEILKKVLIDFYKELR